MSETMVKTYVTALNDLIRHHSRRMAGVKIIYWFNNKVDTQKDLDPKRRSSATILRRFRRTRQRRRR